MNKKTLVILGTSVLAAGALSYLIVRFTRKNKAKEYIEDAYSSVKTAITGEFPLEYGSRGENVKALQGYLNTKISTPYEPLVVDGIFGELTQAALNRTIGKKSIGENEFKQTILYKTT
jgi:peptidoglycan hydrolase-like protein with peptidoglycan-binding domain